MKTKKLNGLTKLYQKPFKEKLKMKTNFPVNDDEKKLYLREGKPIRFPDPVKDKQESSEQKIARTIKASWIKELLEDNESVLNIPVVIENAIIEDSVKFLFVNFKKEFEIKNSEFTEDVDFSFSSFQRFVNLNGSNFQKAVNFRSVDIKFDFKIIGTRFRENANFEEIQINQIFYAQGAQFREANFGRMKVSKSVLFRPLIQDNVVIPVVFNGSVKFNNVKIESYVDFRGVKFNEAVDFTHTYFGSTAQFNSIVENDEALSCEFKGDAKFRGVNFAGDALFDGALFEKYADFSAIKVEGYLLFRIFDHNGNLINVKFNKNVRFYNAIIKKDLTFLGTLFKGEAIFQSIVVEGDVLFFPFENKEQIIPVEFHSNVNFSNSIFKGITNFTRASFKSTVNFKQANFYGNALFIGTQFEATADFSGIKAEEYLLFHPSNKQEDITCSVFGGDARFFNAYIKKNAEFGSTQFKGKTNFEGIIVEGSLHFRPFNLVGKKVCTCFEGDARFFHAHIKGIADFSGAVFNSLADFEGIKIERAAFFRNSYDSNKLMTFQFNGEVNFRKAYFGDEVSFDGAFFKDSATFKFANFSGNAYFAHYKYQGSIYPTVFNGEAIFTDTKFNSSLICVGAQFYGKADFSSTQIQGLANFNSALTTEKIIPCQFNDKAIFDFAFVKSNCTFRGTQFKDNVYFSGAQIGGELIFKPEININSFKLVSFEGNASFVGCRIGDNTVFEGIEFHRRVDFQMLSVNGNMVFEPVFFNDHIYQVKFNDLAEFSHTKINGRLIFESTQFLEKSYFDKVIVREDAIFGQSMFNEEKYNTKFYKETDFNNSKFNNLLDFQEVIFEKDVNLTRVEVQGIALLNETVFNDGLNLREAHFSRVIFSNNEQNEEQEDLGFQFKGRVNLTGFTYNRIEVNWNELLNHVYPYDRQPFSYLERIFRSSGHDLQADKVYLKRRKQENNILWAKLLNKNDRDVLTKTEKVFGIIKSPLKKYNKNRSQLPFVLFDLIEKWLFRYGVRPFRLLFISFFVILVGFFVFIQPNSIIQKESRLRTGEVINPNFSTAFNVSLNQFIPIVEIPPGSEWKPSDARAIGWGKLGFSFAGYATIHRLFGFILIPLGIVALTGRLYRREK